MKKFFKISFAILLAMVLLFQCISIADVGDFESYDSDWGSDSSWDSWDSWDSDWDSGGNYYYSGDGTGDFGGSLLLAIIIIIIAIRVSSKKGNATPYQATRTYTPREETPDSRAVLAQIKEVDEYFNEENFLSYAKNLFVKLQNAWTARDWETIRPLESEDLFEQHSNQLKQYITRKQINVMDRIAVNYAKLYSFEQDNDKDTLSILLNSSMIDYIKEEDTDKVVMGDKTTRRTKTYKLTFIRKKGVKTAQSTGEVKTTNCPNCGAPTKITSAGKCEYCGVVIKTGDHDWVLSNLEPYRG